MSKTASVFILDASPTMAEKGHFKDSKTMVSKILNDKLFKGAKNDNVGLLTVGTAETRNRVNQKDGEGYENITDYGYSIDSNEILFNPTISMLKYLESLQPQNIAADIFDAIILAVQMVKDHCVSKKTGKPLQFEKRIYLFTDAKSDIQFDFFDELIEQCDLHKIKIIICGFDFIEDTPNIRQLQLLLERKDDSMGALYSSEDALQVSLGLSTKEFNPFRIFNGPLLLGDPEVYGDAALSIQVNVYARTNQLKLDTPQKFSSICKSIENVNNSESFGKVAWMKKYFPREGSEIGQIEEIEISQFIRAYRYGSHLIPITDEDKDASKIVYPKSFKILYFTNQENIKREHYMSNVLAVVPDPVNNFAKIQFEALMAAMHDMKVVAICKYNARDTTNPKLYILKYNKKGHGYLIQVFIFNKIPFLQDIKKFTFEPCDFLRLDKINIKSKKSSQTNPNPKESSIDKHHPLDRRLVDLDKANHIVDSFIDSMLLEDQEYLPKKTFNPVYQRMKQFISFRAMGGVGLPKVDEMDGNILKPRDIDDNIENEVLGAFDLKYVPILEKKKKKVISKNEVDYEEEQYIYDELHREEENKEQTKSVDVKEERAENDIYPDKVIFPGKKSEIKNTDNVEFSFGSTSDISMDRYEIKNDTEEHVGISDEIIAIDEDPLDFLFE